MGRDSSGTYTRTQSDYAFNTVISETQINSELNDIKAEITASLEASGKKVWTGNQNAGSTKITALAVGSALTDSTNLGQVQDGGMQYATGSGTNTIVATMAPAITAYVAGQTFRIKMAAGANTGATTLNLNSVGAKAITKRGTTALAAGDIPASAMFEVAYDGTQFQLINVGQATTALVSDSSPQLGGFLDANGNYIQMQKGGDIASASPTVIDTDGDYFICTGTTGFSAMTVDADRHFFLEFAAVLTMTHGAGTLDLPGGANITTAAGDVGEFFSTASNVVTCVNYAKKSGKPIVTNFAGSDIAANAIDSDHYVDGSIDSIHINDLDASKLTGSLPASMSEITKSTSEPTETTNPSGGVGTVYLRTTTGEMYCCTDATTNANVWTNIGDGTGRQPAVSAATGGNSIITIGNYKAHVFTSSGTFAVSDFGQPFDYLVIAGGAGGNTLVGGGGGAGGLRNSYNSETSGGGGASETSLTMQAASYTVTVGAGGASGVNGSTTSLSGTGITTVSCVGGGTGGSYPNGAGIAGGSGGGGEPSGAAGAGTANQGYAGGADTGSHSWDNAGGGGGAGAVGSNPNSTSGGAGGVGVQSNIDGNNYFWAAGGGGAGNNDTSGAGNGGLGGGGAGSSYSYAGGTGGGSALNSGVNGATGANTAGGAAGVNTGSGGGGGAANSGAGGQGGSGIVIIRYRFQ